MTTTILYYRYPDGSFSQREIETSSEEGTVDLPPPTGATEITEQEYTAGVAALDAAREQKIADEEAAAQVLACEDYVALIAAGLPEASARRMSGCLAAPEVNNE